MTDRRSTPDGHRVVARRDAQVRAVSRLTRGVAALAVAATAVVGGLAAHDAGSSREATTTATGATATTPAATVATATTGATDATAATAGATLTPVSAPTTTSEAPVATSGGS